MDHTESNNFLNVQQGHKIVVPNDRLPEEEVIQNVKTSTYMDGRRSNPYNDGGQNQQSNTTTVKKTIVTNREEYDPFSELEGNSAGKRVETGAANNGN